MIIGTAGHVDHGKTALVKALTGVDADRLAEEKARGITINLGYAYSRLPNGDILGFVDVPGHERFVHNMLAGATGIDFALLVVAADDGIMPQTVEHLQILDLLGITKGAVALTKIDRVDSDRMRAVLQTIEALLAGTGLAGSRILPLSAVTGDGVSALRNHLERSAASRTIQVPQGGFRLAVDRSFTLTGTGTVVTGTVFSGRVRLGDRLLLSPCGRPARVRGIHAQNSPAEAGGAGERCALNLADVDKADVHRGDWVLDPMLHRPTHRLDIRLRLLPSEGRSLQHGASVHVHLGAFHATGRVALLQDDPLGPGCSALAQLTLDKPTSAAWGDRCILRDASALRTIAGGRVLDTRAPARGRRTAQRLAVLAAWELTDPRDVLQALLSASPQGIDLQAFGANANLTAAEVDAMCVGVAVRRLDSTRPVAFAAEHWMALHTAVIETLRHTHTAAPDALGLNTEQLRLRTAPRLERAAFAQVLGELYEEGRCLRDGSWWHLPGHRIVLSTQDQALWHRIAPLLTEQPFQPPRVRDIARTESLDEATVRQLLIRVARQGSVYKVAHDHYFDRDAVAQLAGIVRELAAGTLEGTVTAAEFRDRIGTGRKLAIQILEYFDRIGLTRRLRDIHRLRDGSLVL
jgi:selenocysteine-specific elongation factor